MNDKIIRYEGHIVLHFVLLEACLPSLLHPLARVTEEDMKPYKNSVEKQIKNACDMVMDMVCFNMLYTLED